MLIPCVIYKITHNVTNRAYIGSSGKLKERLHVHFNKLKLGKHSIEDMQSDYDTYGNNFTVEIIGKIDDYKDKDKEFTAMEKYHTHIRGQGYNYKDKHFTNVKGG